MLVQHVGRVGVLLAENRNQDVGAGDLVLSSGLHVVQRALQNPLESDGGLRIAVVVLFQHRDGFVQHLPDFTIQGRQVGIACAEHTERRGVVQQRQQQMFHGQEFVPLVARFLVCLADGDFEFLAEHVPFRLPFVFDPGPRPGFRPAPWRT